MLVLKKRRRGRRGKENPKCMQTRSGALWGTNCPWLRSNVMNTRVIHVSKGQRMQVF